MQTVAELRKAGFRIRVNHYRYYENEEGDLELLHRKDVEEANYLYNVINPDPVSRGGQTIIEVTSPDGKEAEGVAYCSFADNYNKRFGVTKALGRALSELSKV